MISRTKLSFCASWILFFSVYILTISFSGHKMKVHCLSAALCTYCSELNPSKESAKSDVKKLGWKQFWSLRKLHFFILITNFIIAIGFPFSLEFIINLISLQKLKEAVLRKIAAHVEDGILKRTLTRVNHLEKTNEVDFDRFNPEIRRRIRMTESAKKNGLLSKELLFG